MQVTIRRSALASLVFLPALLAGACSRESPTSAILAPSSPRHDGGATFGSGARATSETGNTTTAADSGSTATRGGATFGSGS
jgi:hypothetical protein